MYLETKDLHEDGLPVAVVFPLSAMAGLQAEGESARLTGTLQPRQREFHLTGQFTTRVGLPCSRCTTRFTTPVEIDINLLYSKDDTTANLPEELELTLEDCSRATLDDEGRIDLLSLARDQLYLWVPLKSICSLDCKGLCSRCGANQNTKACSCATTWIDPRLAPLAEFKKNT
jgi:uncharacterized protein